MPKKGPDCQEATTSRACRQSSGEPEQALTGGLMQQRLLAGEKWLQTRISEEEKRTHYHENKAESSKNNYDCNSLDKKS
tara:strand:- start:1589 stop:1825 length:237 start_codon:yes stop_codon:yes gene_type:complete